jgi:beta-1,4-mannosyl-glycoprotein beta-1,4-N-acetylglucosaminyltransferase
MYIFHLFLFFRKFLLLTSDVDEIPKARFIQALASCQLYVPFQPAVLQCDYHYYSFEYTAVRRHFWPGGTLSQFSPNAKIPSDLRTARLNYRHIPDACFHCSYCFDTLASVRLKLSSFSHTDLDIEKYRDQEFLIDRFQKGIDLLDRHSEELRRSDVYDPDLPRLLQLEPNRFMYMLNRSSLPNAGFRDV